jgi:hypothetical protein
MKARVYLATFFVVLQMFALQSRAQSSQLDEVEERRDIIEGVSREQSWSNSLWTKINRNISVGHFAFTTTPMDQVNDRAARIESYNYFTFDHRISSNQSFSVRPVFYLGTAGTNYRDQYQSADFSIGDAYMNWVVHRVATLPGDWRLKAHTRVYVPTSEDSRKHGMVARLRPWWLLSRNFGRKWEVIFNLEPDYYFVQRTTFLDDRGRALGNRQFGYESKAELRYNFNRTYAATLAGGHAQSWSYASEANNIDTRYRTEDISIEASVSAALKSVFLVLGLSQSHGVARPYSDFSFFRADETEYFLLSSIRF